MNDINSLYKLWCEKAVNDKDLIRSLNQLREIRMRFSTDFIKILNSVRLVCAEL